MRIGIISDTHGHAERLRGALDIFQAHGVGAIVHCGDVGSRQCVEVLAAAACEVYMVSGNVDRDVQQLIELAEELDVHFAGEVVEVPLGDGRCLVATHGNDQRVLGELVSEGNFPYVCHGHTHKPRNEKIGDVRVINPGAIHSPKGARTVAVLDTDTDAVEHVLVP